MKIMSALILSMLFISGCAYKAYKSDHIVKPCSFPQQTKESIYAYSKVGETTNIDVLKFLQYPTVRYVSDSGLIGYMYTFRKDVPLEKKSTGLTTEVQYMLSTAKSCLFIFNKNGILKNVMYNENSLGYQTKYDLIKAPDTVDDDKFIQTFQNLKNGSSTGAIFRQIGKPQLVHEYGKTEIWQYDHPYASGLPSTIRGDSPLLFLLELKDNRLVDKHIMVENQDYTEEELKVLPPIESKKLQKTGTETTEKKNHG
ncbi:hypothetical protein [Desulfovibrio sp. ZJ200]|uniref:hypothetical protein n=1 Tax=Desulfovibrio sp. ZJ200 TaxID=2709792 RepID=UPI0013EADF6D|nr:hypothetical protein [Desulfovibrio sp. ZJ200]